MTKFFSVFFCVTCFCFSACVGPPKIPGDVLPKDKMTAILTEVHINQSYVGRLNFGSSDSTQLAYNQLEKDLFERFKVDTTTYKRSFNFYAKNPEYMIEIYNGVVKELEKRAKDSTKIKPKGKPTR